MRLRVGHQHSQFWPILACFVDYYSLFLVPGVISTIKEPRPAFTCQSSIVAVFVDFDPFHGLLLTVLGSKVISVVVEPQGALTYRSSTMAVLADFGLFHGLLLTVLGSRSGFHG